VDPELDFIEWHDARLARVVREGSVTRLEFSRVPIYRKIGPGNWYWEDGPVVLVMQEARVDCEPPGDERTGDAGWVMDCTRSEPVAANDIQSLGRGVGPGCISFEMADCSTVAAAFEHAQLMIVGPLIKNRPWPDPADPRGKTDDV